MGRARTNRARRHFKYASVSDKSTGQVENCQHVASGDHGGNLERHLQRRHKGVYDKILADNKACCVGRGGRLSCGHGAHASEYTEHVSTHIVEVCFARSDRGQHYENCIRKKWSVISAN
ncbi:hypothetical protein MRX96_002834 [Rhipicephalus microplus]